MFLLRCKKRSISWGEERHKSRCHGTSQDRPSDALHGLRDGGLRADLNHDDQRQQQPGGVGLRCPRQHTPGGERAGRGDHGEVFDGVRPGVPLRLGDVVPRKQAGDDQSRPEGAHCQRHEDGGDVGVVESLGRGRADRRRVDQQVGQSQQDHGRAFVDSPPRGDADTDARERHEGRPGGGDEPDHDRDGSEQGDDER